MHFDSESDSGEEDFIEIIGEDSDSEDIEESTSFKFDIPKKKKLSC